MSQNFDPHGEHIGASRQENADEFLLDALRYGRQKLGTESVADFCSKHTSVQGYHDFRRRMVAFGNAVFPCDDGRDPRSGLLAYGLIYAYRIIGLYRPPEWGMLGKHYRSLKFALAEVINLEGEVLQSPFPAITLDETVPEKFRVPGGAFDSALPLCGNDTHDRANFLLGAGLVLSLAQGIHTGVLSNDGEEEARAQLQMKRALDQLRQR